MSVALAPSQTPEVSTRVQNEHVLALDGVRGIAVLLVIFHHCVCWNDAVAWQAHVTHSVLERLLKFVAEWSNSGVDLFFTLSGFLITSILLRTRNDAHYFKNFYCRRALRIFPLYYIYLALILYVVPLFVNEPILSTLRQDDLWYGAYLGNVAMFIHGTPGNMFLSHSWSLCVEEQFYLIWPFVVRFLNTKQLAIVLCVVFVVANIVRIILESSGLGGFGTIICTPGRLDVFAAGALIAIYWKDQRIMHTKHAWLLIGLFIVAAAAMAKLQIPGLRNTLGLLLVCLACSAFVSLTLRSNLHITKVLSRSPLRMFAKYSYSMYLFHFPIVYLSQLGFTSVLAEHTQCALQFWICEFALVTGLSLLIGYLTFMLVERHFLNLKEALAPYN